MTTKYLTGDDQLMAKLEGIAERMGNGAVEVGFMEDARYPDKDGTLVALVAYWNEFGHYVRSKFGDYFQLPRPFFRNMIAVESPTWSAKIAKLAKGTNYDGDKVLALMGEDIGGALIQSINELESPPLAESTIEAKGFAKPLINTKQMLNSVHYQVNDEAKIKVEP